MLNFFKIFADVKGKVQTATLNDGMKQDKTAYYDPIKSPDLEIKVRKRTVLQLQKELHEGVPLDDIKLQNKEELKSGQEAPWHELVYYENGSDIRIGEVVPGSSALPILIATTWRSGSTFLGDLINSYPGTFYFPEPLHYETKTDELTFFKNLLNCKLEEEHVKHMSKFSTLMSDNWRWNNICNKVLKGTAACYKTFLFQSACELHPLRLIKTVRFPMSEVEGILADPTLPKFKVIALFRDPRGIMNSRSNLKWCGDLEHCGDTKTVCELFNSNMDATFRLAEKFPGRVHLVRYEDLSMDPYRNAQDILRFLDLPQDPRIEQFLEKHTKGDKKVPKRNFNYNTFRNSSATAFAWRSKIDHDYSEEIQRMCKNLMEVLGYKLFQSESELRDIQVNALSKTKKEIWS